MRTLFHRSAALALALGTSLLACGGSDAQPPPDLNHRDIRLTLLHTADWHSRLFPYNQTVSSTDANLGLQQANAPFGGAARINWLIQRERARSDRVLHLDSGDCFQGAPIFNFFSGEAEVRALDATGVDGVAVGNHEFDRGAANFALQYRRWATFPVLACNYLFEDPTIPGDPGLANFVRPYHMYDVNGLKVAVIGFGNLSSITSLFDQPNRLGATALNTTEIAQFYIDMVQAEGADLVVGLSHLGLTDDQNMIANTTGFDVVLGGHLHIVLNPTQEVPDCQPYDTDGNHFIAELDPNDTSPPGECDRYERCCAPAGVCPPDPVILHTSTWTLAPGFRKRMCTPRTVLLQHSGAFIKYLGRLDLVLSNDPAQIAQGALPDGGTVGPYDPHQGFEVVGHRYTLFPVDSTVPEEPVEARMLEPYALRLTHIANLDTLVGYAPATVSRTNQNSGDSPMGNLVSTAMWRRLGVQTDFSLTNTLGIRDSIPPGPVAIDQIYNVFPFDNSITTMLLSGREIREMFDFVARRSSDRGCNSQVQIAGARVIINCTGCDRDGVPGPDMQINDMGQMVPITACATTINVGLRDTTDLNGNPIPGIPQTPCNVDADCNPDPTIAPEALSLCEPNAHKCMLPIAPETGSLNGSYSLAANNYIAGGGSGFFVLQRNTTQVDTQVQQRDAVIDHVRQGNPCGYNDQIASTYRTAHPDQDPHGDDGLQSCTTNTDCGEGFVCSCPERYDYDPMTGVCTGDDAANNWACTQDSGRCVLQTCRDDLTTSVEALCPIGPTPDDPNARTRCLCAAQGRAAESCRILSCFDANVGAFADGRIRMESR